MSARVKALLRGGHAWSLCSGIHLHIGCYRGALRRLLAEVTHSYASLPGDPTSSASTQGGRPTTRRSRRPPRADLARHHGCAGGARQTVQAADDSGVRDGERQEHHQHGAGQLTQDQH